MEFGERFTYQTGDVTVQKGQCKNCIFNEASSLENGRPICCHFPQGKPLEVLINKMQCPHYAQQEAQL